ncbi:GNAT family N-acetyltransferase [Litoribacter ruber]|uniref:GNAT family N-acetyltransferase n=1 Tax=Litoribacter ruber TaxID=702568 RepID=UPI001BDA04FD|nr:GNAT family N-acetyltransferase [Litoribacter ruber]MBT0809948.1 GNAT family N-acetyltransferase [Litoribacter ruber]
MKLDDSLSPSPERISDVQIFLGNEVYDFLEQKDYSSQWSNLYETCPWATVFQGLEFFKMFHEVYKQQYQPLLVVYFVDDKLKALLPLSFETSDGRITGAGVNDAHYHAWICSEEIGSCFFKKAVEELRVQFPLSSIRMEQLPVGIPLGWLGAVENFDGVKFTTSVRPLVNLKNPSIDKLARKKDFKSNNNRLKKCGDFEVEFIKDQDKFDQALETLVHQSDFRKGAFYGLFPFHKNPYRSILYKEMFRKKMMFGLVLKLDGEILAGITGTIGKDGWCHGSGLNCHSPLFDYYSPGFLSFIHLIQHLENEGYETLDLSTGMLDYKKRIANHYDEVYELFIPAVDQAIISKKKTGLKDKLKERIWAFLEKKPHLDFEREELRAKFKLYHKQRDYFNLIHFYQTGKPYLKIEKYVSCSEAEKLLGESYSKNSLKELLMYRPKHESLTKREFLLDAFSRFKSGEVCYSQSKNGKLLGCLWCKIADEKTVEITSCCPSFIKGVRKTLQIGAHANPEKVKVIMPKSVEKYLS